MIEPPFKKLDSPQKNWYLAKRRVCPIRMKTNHSPKTGSRILLPSTALILLSLLCWRPPVFAQSQIHTEPHGYVKVSIAPGTGVTKRTTLVSIPLLDDTQIEGRPSGKITAVSSNTITSAAAGWSPGKLSQPEFPFVVEITSGQLKGRMLLVATNTPNTSDTLAISPSEMTSLSSGLTVVKTGEQEGDTFRVRPVDTLSSLFGTGTNSIVRGGASPASADTVTLVVNGAASTYFLNTSVAPPRWTRVGLTMSESDNVPVPPYASMQYARLDTSPLEFIITGRVPSGSRQVAIKSSGTTLVSPYWPVNQTLSDFGLQNMPGWRSSTSARDADTVVLLSSGTAASYFYDGTNWRRISLGSPLSDGTLIPFNGGVMTIRKGSSQGHDQYTKEPPFSLE